MAAIVSSAIRAEISENKKDVILGIIINSSSILHAKHQAISFACTNLFLYTAPHIGNIISSFSLRRLLPILLSRDW